MTFISRPYEDADFDAVNTLYSRVFPGEFSADIWRWKMRGNPAGEALIHLLVNGGKVVGQYAALPVTMKVMGKKTYCYQVIDSMVDPEYRKSLGKHRAFALIAQSVFEEFENQKIHITYGFPNRHALKFGKKILHYEDIVTLTKYVLPLNHYRFMKTRFPETPWTGQIGGAILLAARTAASRIKHRHQHMRSWKVRQIERFPEAIGSVWERFSSGFKITVHRDCDYMNWRYSDRPGAHYLIYEMVSEHDETACGWLVAGIRNAARSGYITDWIMEPDLEEFDEAALHLLNFVIKDCGRIGLNCLEAYGGANHWCQDFLKRSGFIQGRKPSNITLVGRCWNPAISVDILTRGENWYITIGDCDGW